MPAAKRDYYEVLGVSRSASDADLKRAYRRLARKFHPDVNPGDHSSEAKFKEISEAYQILTDPQKRAAYDQFGHAAFTPPSPGSPGAGAGWPGGVRYETVNVGDLGDLGLGDIFEEFLGKSAGGRRTRIRHDEPVRGADSYQSLTIDFKDAYTGKTVEMEFLRRVTCTKCGGTRAEPGHPPKTCPDCKGAGQKAVQRGFITMAQPCNRCGGKGTVITNLCTQCSGRGYTSRMERVSVRIPAGVDTGSKVRLTGKGEPGENGGPPGDVLINVEVRTHPPFERRGDNTYINLPITFAEAALGAEVEVPTPGGLVMMRIPPGTESGRQFRLRGRGFPHVNSVGSGDLFADIRIVVPRSLDMKSRELVRELTRLNPQNPRLDMLGKV